ncbi:MAG: hypothetical protein QGH15_22130 [Kiritimatiellia bacterium]|jgi:hypothetical protein|nr:hypothetical protein [Kiritimatiellia bacterium]
MMNRLTIYGGVLVLLAYSAGCVDRSQGVACRSNKLEKARREAASIYIPDLDNRNHDILMTSLGGARHDFRWPEKSGGKIESCRLTVLVRCDERTALFLARVLSEACEASTELFPDSASAHRDSSPLKICVGGRSIQGHIAGNVIRFFRGLLREFRLVSGEGIAEAMQLAHRAERLAVAGDKPGAILMYEDAVDRFVLWVEEDYADMLSARIVFEFVGDYAYGANERGFVLPKDPLKMHRLAFQRLMKEFLVDPGDLSAPVIVAIPRHPDRESSRYEKHPSESFPPDARKFLMEYRRKRQGTSRTNGQ